MSKVVKHHYPVHRLPDDLRQAVSGAASVSVTLESDDDEIALVALGEIRRRVEERRRQPGSEPISERQAVDRIRALRDEWD